MADTITLKELKPGDIILFSPTDELISKLIVFLTHSQVSHTGMSDYNPGYVLNEEGDGALRRFLAAPGERTMYVRRLKNAPDTSKVADIAKEYVDQNIPYPKSNLLFLGIYILAGDFIPNNIAGNLIKSVIKVACYELIKFANELQFHDSKNPMVCSQFAAACYDQAAMKYGPEYKIHYNEKVGTIPSLLRQIIEQLEGDGDKTYAEEEPAKGHLLLGAAAGTSTDPAALDAAPEEDVEESLQKLLDCMMEKEQEIKESENRDQEAPLCCVGAKHDRISDDVIMSFYKYAKLVLQIFGPKKASDTNSETDADLKADNGINADTGFTLEAGHKSIVSAEEIKKVLTELMQFQETFVTPQDLLVNTTNLEDMGILTYTQEELDSYREN